jgi:hypothetical protein
MNARFFGWAVLAVGIVLGGGWFWGAAGKSAIEQERRMLDEQLIFARAQEVVSDGRVSLFLNNYGDAARLFTRALGFVGDEQVRLRESGQAERAGRLEVAAAHLRDAQRLATALDQNAQSAAEQALQALRSVEAR